MMEQWLLDVLLVSVCGRAAAQCARGGEPDTHPIGMDGSQ